MSDCVSDSLSLTENLIYRNFLSAWRAGGTLWWMDLFGRGWYRDPGLVKALSFCRAFAERQTMKRESTAQIAFFADARSAACERAVPFLISPALKEQQLLETVPCGAPVDLYYLEDLEELARRDRLKQYRFVIISAAHRIDGSLRRCMEESLKKDSRSILFLFAPGIAEEDGFSAGSAGEVTGIRLSEVPPKSFLTETRLAGRRIVYGLPQNLSPRLVCTDPDAETLGWYVQGSEAKGGASFVRKEFGDWTGIWSASPGLPAEWIRTLAAQSGVHMYSECGLCVFAAENWIGVSAGLPGDYTISMPRPSVLLDSFTGRRILDGGTEFRVTLKRGEVRIWERPGRPAAPDAE